MLLSEATLDTLAGVIHHERPIGAHELARFLERPRAWETSRQLIILERVHLVAKVPGLRRPLYIVTEAGNMAMYETLPRHMRGVA